MLQNEGRGALSAPVVGRAPPPNATNFLSGSRETGAEIKIHHPPSTARDTETQRMPNPVQMLRDFPIVSTQSENLATVSWSHTSRKRRKDPRKYGHHQENRSSSLSRYSSKKPWRLFWPRYSRGRNKRHISVLASLLGVLVSRAWYSTRVVMPFGACEKLVALDGDARPTRKGSGRHFGRQDPFSRLFPPVAPSFRNYPSSVARVSGHRDLQKA